MKHLKLFENIDPFEEDDWDDEEFDEKEHKYYIGSMTHDNIEIYPCTIENGKVLRHDDGHEMIRISQTGLASLGFYKFYIPRHEFIRTGLLTYIYTKDVDESALKKALLKFLDRNGINIIGEWGTGKLGHNINVQDITNFGDGMVTNLI